jgi:hypothetical protein
VPDIMQGGIVTIGGVQCDLDAGLSSDFGQWPRPASPATTWQAWHGDAQTSLEQLAQQVNMLPSSILRHTATHYGAFDAVTSAYVDGLAAGTVVPSAPIPVGAALRRGWWPFPGNVAGWWVGRRLCAAGWHNVTCRSWARCPEGRLRA